MKTRLFLTMMLALTMKAGVLFAQTNSQVLEDGGTGPYKAIMRITGTVLAIIFHLLQFLYYSERDTRQPCKLANTSAEVFDRLPFR